MTAQAITGVTPRPTQLTLLAFLGVVLLGGNNTIALGVAVQELAPLWSAGLRFLLAGLLMAAIALLGRRQLPRGRSLGGAALYGVIGFAASFGLITPSLRVAAPSTAAVLIALVPLLTFGLAILQRQERFHPQGLIGAATAVGGIGIIVFDQLTLDVPPGALLAIILGAACIAQSTVLLKWIPRSDPIATNAVAMVVGGSLLAGTAVVIGEEIALPVQTDTWVAMLYIVIGGSAAMFGLYVYALKRWTASAVSYATLLMPLVTLSVSWALFDAMISGMFLLGAAVMLAGVYVGAFLRVRPGRSSALSAPECLPVDACADAPPQPLAASR